MSSAQAAQPIQAAQPNLAAQSPAEASVVILPTLTPTGNQPAVGKYRRPLPKDGVLWERARELDGLLRDTIQDLGLIVDLSGMQRVMDRVFDIDASEKTLLEQSKRSSVWYLAPRIEVDGGGIMVRLMLIPPGGGYAVVRTETVMPEEFQLRVVIMLRDVVNAGKREPVADASSTGQSQSRNQGGGFASHGHSEGRALLALHAAAFGAYLGYSVQRFAGSDDVRLTYPLVAIGTGAGLGGSLIIAQEWDIGTGDAWYMSAGMVWPTFGSLMLAMGHDVEPESDRHVWGLAGGFAGIAMASFALSFAGMSSGGAAVAHSGGLLGTAFGAGTEIAIRGRTGSTPHYGLGIGALGGVVIGGIWGRWVEESPSRTVMIDIGAGVGGVAFAALGSPLLITDLTEGRQRAWVILTMSGAVAGATAAYFMTAPGPNDDDAAWQFPINGLPMAGVIGQSLRGNGSAVPVYGVGWTGSF